MFGTNLFSDHKSNHAKVIKRLVDCLPSGSNKITLGSFKAQLALNSKQGSLQSFLDVLIYFNYKGAGFNLDRSNISDLEAPFIAHLINEESGFVTVTRKDDNMVSYYNGISDKEVTIEDFCQSWSGATLVAEGNIESGDKDYKSKLLLNRLDSVKKSIIGILITLINSYAIYYIIRSPEAFTYISLLFLSQIGLFASLALTSLSIEKSSSSAKMFCSRTGKSDCNSVLDSKGAKLFNIFPWSELGIFFFTALFSSIVFSTIIHDLTANLNIISIICLCSAPYPLYSVYYQKYVVKSWCALCLSVQIVIVAMCLLLIPHLPNGILDFNLSISVLLGTALTLLALILIIPIWKRSAEVSTLKAEIAKFKMNHDVFNMFLDRQVAVEIPEELGIPISRNGSNDTLMVVINLYCTPCKKSFEKILRFIQTNANFNINIGILAFNNEKDKMTILLAHVLALREDGHEIIDILSFWFVNSNNNYEVFCNNYPIDIERRHLEMAIRQGLMVNTLPISSTPAYILNNKVFPDLFDIDNLEYLLIDTKKPYMSDYRETQVV